MKYTVYSYHIIDGDTDFIERIKKEGESDKIEEAFKLAYELDVEHGEKKRTEKLIDSIVYLVYDKNNQRVNGYPGQMRDEEIWKKAKVSP